MALTNGTNELLVSRREHAGGLKSQGTRDRNFALEDAGVFVLCVEVAQSACAFGLV